MGKSEDRLHKRLRNTEHIKDNDTAVKDVIEAFSDYYGDKAEESIQKAKMYLGLTIVAFALIIILAMTML